MVLIVLPTVSPRVVYGKKKERRDKPWNETIIYIRALSVSSTSSFETCLPTLDRLNAFFQTKTMAATGGSGSLRRRPCQRKVGAQRLDDERAGSNQSPLSPSAHPSTPFRSNEGRDVEQVKDAERARNNHIQAGDFQPLSRLLK